jgi:hypothetical protein
MTLSFGVGIPKGDYASSESIYNSGFANNGLVAEYSGAYFIKKNIGISGSLKFTSNLTREDIITSELDKLQYADAPVNTQITYNISQWNLVSVKTGPILTYPLGNLSIDAFFLAGIDVINQPDMEMISDMGSNVYYTVSLQTNNASLGFDTGLNFRYRLNEFTGIRLFATYQQTSANGDVIQYLNSAIGNSLGSYQCKIQLINAGFGLVYYL